MKQLDKYDAIMYKYKRVYALIFLILLFGFSIYNISIKKDDIVNKVNRIERPRDISNLQFYLSNLDGTLTDKLVGKAFFNSIYAYVYRFFGKNEENTFRYVRDKNGFLYSGNFYNSSNIETLDIAKELRELNDNLPEASKLVLLVHPGKYNESWTDAYAGIPYNDMNDYADEILRYVRRMDLDYIDYREVFTKQGMGMEDIFYHTAPDITVPANFIAMNELVRYINQEYDAGLDNDEYYRDISNYYVENYEDIFIGSQGRFTGSEFAGIKDNYTFIIPAFEGEYEYNYTDRHGKSGHKSGNIMNTLISKAYLEYKDPYIREMNYSYLEKDSSRGTIENKLNDTGPSVLFISDTNIAPMAVFMAPMCSKVDVFYYKDESSGKIEDMVKSEKYDYICILINIDNLKNIDHYLYVGL